MHDKEFWDLIGWANGAAQDDAARRRRLEEALASLTAEEIEDFYLHYDRRFAAVWTTELARAAKLINCSGDERFDLADFGYFLQWLIDRGKSTYESAFTDPDALADIEEDEPWESEGYWECVFLAWSAVTAQSGARFWESVGGRAANGPKSLPGDWKVSDDELRTQFPRLFARFASD